MIEDEMLKEKALYVHFLNATLCDTVRAIYCLLENYQEENGVRVPEVLVPFMGGIYFLPFERGPRGKPLKAKRREINLGVSLN